MQGWLPKGLLRVLVVILTLQWQLWLTPRMVEFSLFQRTYSPSRTIVLYRKYIIRIRHRVSASQHHQAQNKMSGAPY